MNIEKRIAEARVRARSFDKKPRRTAASVEYRATDGGGYTITGHGAVFNSLSENLGGFREKIDPGAFTSVLAKVPDVRALFNHDSNLVLAATRNGSLGLDQDATGLSYVASVSPGIAATYYGAAMRAQLAEGLVTQSSFAFRVAEDTWDEDPDTGGLIRTIHDFSGLYDVSPVTYPAYPAADSGVAEHAPTDSERDDDGPSAGARADDGGSEDTQADDATTWRLSAVKRRMALREHA